MTHLFVKYATVHFFKLYKSGHNPIRMFFFHIQALVSQINPGVSASISITNNRLVQYNIFSLIFSWFALANLWLTFAIIIDLLPSQNLIAFGNAEVVSDRFFHHYFRSRVNSMNRADSLGELCIERDLLGFPGSAGMRVVLQLIRELFF